MSVGCFVREVRTEIGPGWASIHLSWLDMPSGVGSEADHRYAFPAEASLFAEKRNELEAALRCGDPVKQEILETREAMKP